MIKTTLFYVLLSVLVILLVSPFIIYSVDKNTFNSLFAWTTGRNGGSRYSGAPGERYFGILVLWLLLILGLRPKKRDIINQKIARRKQKKLQAQKAAGKAASAQLAAELFLKLQRMRVDAHLWEIEKLCTPACWKKIEHREKRREYDGLRYRFDADSEPKIHILSTYDRGSPSFTAKITGKRIDGYAPPNAAGSGLKAAAYCYYMWVFQNTDQSRIHFFSKTRFWFSL